MCLVKIYREVSFIWIGFKKCYSEDGEDLEDEDDESSDGRDLADGSPDRGEGSVGGGTLARRIPVGFGAADSLDDEFHENLIYHGLLRKRSVSLEDTTLTDQDVPAFRRERSVGQLAFFLTLEHILHCIF